MEDRESTSLLGSVKKKRSSPPTSEIVNTHGSINLPDTGRANARTIDHIFDEIGFGWFQQRLFLIVGISFSCDLIELALLPFIQGCIKIEMDLSNYKESLLTSVVFAGEVFALVVLCPLADVYGRRAIILGGFFLVIVFGILSCFSPNIYYLVVARGLVGVGIGAQQSVAYDLYAEMMPTNLRNRVMYITFFMVFGTEYVILTARYLLEDYGWRYLTGAAALPTLILAMFGYFYIPESPRWLVSQGRYKEAEEVMKTAAIMNEIDTGVIVIKETEPEYERNLTDLLQGPFLKQTLLLWTIWTFTNFSIYCIFLSLIRFFSNGDCSFEYGYLSLGIGISVFGIAFATIFVNYSGRVNTQCFLYFGEAIFILLFGMTYMYGSHAAAIAIIFLAYTFSSGAASLLWLHTVELFPTEFRASGHSSCCVVGRIGAFAAVYWMNNYANLKDHQLNGCIFYFLSILLAAVCVYNLPETTGTILDEIDILPHHFVRDNEECKERNNEEEVETSSLLGKIRHRNPNSDSRMIL